MEDIVVALGILGREQASLLTRAKDYVQAREEDLLLAKALKAQEIVAETDIQYALTLQDTLYQHESRPVPRLIDLLLEDKSIDEKHVPAVEKALQEISDSLASGPAKISDDPSVEYECPQPAEEGTSEKPDPERTGAGQAEAPEAEAQATEPDILEETQPELSGREFSVDPTFPVEGIMARTESLPSEDWQRGADDVSDASTRSAVKPSATSGNGNGNGKPGGSFDAGLVSRHTAPVAPAPKRLGTQNGANGTNGSNGGTQTPNEVRAPWERLQETAERRQASLAPVPTVKKNGNRLVKRVHERFEIRDATVHFAGDSLFSALDLYEKPAHIVNISLSGLSMLTRRPLAIGERVKMVMHIPALDDDLHVKGEVRSCATVDKYTQHFRIGLKFLKLSTGVRQKLHRLAIDPSLRLKGKLKRYSHVEVS
jgi:Tfp pilus assembly protein PilZ